MKPETIQDWITLAENAHQTIGQVVLENQAEELGQSVSETLMEMDRMLIVMEESVTEGIGRNEKSPSGMSGGDAQRVYAYAENKDTTGHPADDTVLGGFATRAMARAIGVAEYNATMGRIVAAPTAGSSGILPGCIVSLMEEKGVDRQVVLRALFTAAAFGMVIAEKASLAGAQGGCQAECGSAAGMAAAAVVEALGGTPAQAGDACALAIKSQMGLVCDPIAGLVEVPCIKRNGIGTVLAMAAADLALAGVRSQVPVDEVIDTMREVGASIPCALRETSQGGLAATPTGQRLKAQVFGRNEENTL